MSPPTVKSRKATKYSLKPLLAIPIKSGIRELNNLVEFYLYRAPQIDSAHSCGRLKESLHDEIFKKLIRSASLKPEKTVKMLKSIKSTSFSIMDLDGPELTFGPPRMLCGMMKVETELSALLRHIRNSFAHGWIYVRKTKKGNHICLEDGEPKKNKLTARIVVTDKILKSWKIIIEGYCSSNNMI